MCGWLWWLVVVLALASLAISMVHLQREEAALRHENARLQSEVEEEIQLEHALLDALSGGGENGTRAAEAHPAEESLAASAAAGRRRRLSLLL